MKKIAVLVLTVCLVLCLTACTEVGSKNYNETTSGRLVQIATQQDLYYDISTRIVYIIFNESTNGHKGYGYMSPYYADNGSPYRYNVERGCLEKIDG